MNSTSPIQVPNHHILQGNIKQEVPDNDGFVVGIPQQQVQIPQREINPPNPTFAPAIKEEEPEESLSSFSGFDFRAPCHVENVPQLVNGFVHPHPPSNSEDGGSYNGLLQQMVNGFAAHQQPAEDSKNDEHEERYMQQEAEAADDYEMAVAGNEEEENNQDAESSLVANDGYCDDDPDPYSDLTNSQQQNNGGMEFNETNEEEKPPQNEENNLNGVEKQQKQRNNYPAAEMVAVNGNANDGGDGLESIPGPVNILYNHHYDVILPPGMKSLHLPIEKKGDEKDEILEFEYHKREGFQDQAFACIRNRQLMIVSAPESAGKTAIAAYAIAASKKTMGRRIIYAAPSNGMALEKFHEFSGVFEDPGFVSDEVTLNGLSQCLILSVEKLRRLIYQKSELLSGVHQIVFDDAQFIGDPKIGMIIEECVMILPDHVDPLFLMSVVENGREFAEWICRLRNKPVHYLYFKSPLPSVPLIHTICLPNDDKIHEIVATSFAHDKYTQHFLREDFAKLMAELESAQSQNLHHHLKSSDTDLLVSLLRTLTERGRLPCLIYHHDRKKCENYAFASRVLDLIDDDQKGQVLSTFEKAIATLLDDEARLSQINSMRKYILRGIAFYHHGLLPLMREIIQLLFAEGLIKALFTTDDFFAESDTRCMTVLFMSLRTLDSNGTRFLTPGEYARISGRAKQRTPTFFKGLSIVYVDSKIDSAFMERLVKGKGDTLSSSLRVSFNLILNQLTMFEHRNTILRKLRKHSFAHIRNAKNMQQLQLLLNEKQLAFDSLPAAFENEMSSYTQLCEKIDEKELQIKKEVFTPDNLMPFLMSGRLLKINLRKVDFDWGVLVNFSQRRSPGDPEASVFIVHVAVELSKESHNNGGIDNNYNGSGCYDLSQLRPPTPPQAAAALENGEDGDFFRRREMRETGNGGSSSSGFPSSSFGSASSGFFSSSSVSGSNQQQRFSSSSGFGGASSSSRQGQNSWTNSRSSFGSSEFQSPVPIRGVLDVVPFTFDCISGVGKFRIKVPSELDSDEAKLSLHHTLAMFRQRFPIVTELQNNEETLRDFTPATMSPDALMAIWTELESLREQLERHPLKQRADFPKLQRDLERRKRFKAELASLDASRAKMERFSLADEFDTRLAILQVKPMMKYVSEKNVLTHKGIIASHIYSANEILVTELMFYRKGTFLSELTPEQLAALISCLVFTEETAEQHGPRNDATLVRLYRSLWTIDNNLKTFLTQQGVKLLFDADAEDHYAKRPKAGLMQAVYDWSRGEAFATILAQNGNISEGSIVDCLRNIDRLMKEMIAGICAVRDVPECVVILALLPKLRRASVQLRHGVPFMPTLYI